MIDNKTIRQVVINKALLPCTQGELEYETAQTQQGGYLVTFITNVVDDIKDLNVSIVPIQSGHGDPAPDNERPITGTDTLTFSFGPVTTPSTSPTNITVNLGETVYGGYYDADTGELWKTYESEVFNGAESETWAAYGSQNGFTKYMSNMKSGSAMQDGCANFLQTIPNYTSFGIRFGGNNNNTLYLCHITDNITGVTDVASWKTYLQNNNLQVVYPLATPVKVATLDPLTIKTYKGEQRLQNNNLFEFSLKYPKMVGGSCEIGKQFLPIFYPNGKGVNRSGSTF